MRPLMEEKATTLPPPALIISGNTPRTRRRVPMRHTSSTERMCSSLYWAAGPRVRMPAAQTSAWGVPVWLRALSINASTLAWSVTSRGRRKRARSSGLPASAKERAPATTSHPALKSASAVAFPKPLEAPVIQTTGRVVVCAICPPGAKAPAHAQSFPGWESMHSLIHFVQLHKPRGLGVEKEPE